MGSIMKSKCHNCNFTNQFHVGSNMFNVRTVCYCPAINIETGEFEEVNYYTIDKEKYKHYGEPELKTQEEDNKRDFKGMFFNLNRIGNYCPSCKNKSLEFILHMLSD